MKEIIFYYLSILLKPIVLSN